MKKEDTFIPIRDGHKVIKRGTKLAELVLELLNEMGVSEKRSIVSFLRILILHLLKFDYQPKKRSISWKSSARNSSNALRDMFNRSQTLKNYAIEQIEKDKSIYSEALNSAIDETGLEREVFPEENEYDLIDIIEKKNHPIFGWSPNYLKNKKRRRHGR